MKNKAIKCGWLICSLLLLTTGVNKAEDKPESTTRMLTLDGHAIDYNTFWMNSHGVLAIAKGNPQSLTHKPVSFRVSIRRAGVVVKKWPAAETETVYSLQLDELWHDARLGDELLIEPVDPVSSQSLESVEKWVIKLRGPNWLAHCLPVAEKC